jgi:hypothetical protein
MDTDDNGAQVNPESRAKLYDRLVQRYSKALGYRAFRADNGDIVIYELSRIKQGVMEAVDIGQEWMSDTELDQYVPDRLQQQWRELLGYDRDGNPSALWANLTGGYEPDVNDPQHRALMVKVANKWFAAKKIPNVKFFNVKDADDELEWLVQIGQQGVAEGKVINTYLWHGSRQKINMLEPRQSVDTGGAAGSNQNAIYATSEPKVAIAMGLTTPGSDTGMFPNDPQMVLFSGKIRKGEYVYLHKLPFKGPDGKPQFVQGGNSREFHSIPGVEGIKPIEIKAIPVNKYLNLIRKATPADLKLRKKYMKKQGVAEATGDERFDTMMGRMQKEPRIPDPQMPPTDVRDLYQWAVKNNKPYHKIFATWANREGFKSVAPALMKAGNLDSDALDYWTPDVWEMWYGSEMPKHLRKDRIPDELRDYLETVFDAYDNIVFDWPTEYRHIGGLGLAEGSLREFAPPERGDGQEDRFYFQEEFESNDSKYKIELYRNAESGSYAVSFHRDNMQYVMYPIDGIDAGDLADGADRYVKEIKRNAAHGSQEDFVALSSADLETFIPPEQGVAEGSLREFAPDDGGGDEEDMLLKFARMWYNGDLPTQQQIEKILARSGWEIGELESEEGGAFVVQSGDENGNSYIGFSVADLTEGLAEGYGRYYCSTDKRWKERKGPKQTRKTEAVHSAAQQAAIAIHKKE